jgi:hypothetical protein
MNKRSDNQNQSLTKTNIKIPEFLADFMSGYMYISPLELNLSKYHIQSSLRLDSGKEYICVHFLT